MRNLYSQECLAGVPVDFAWMHTSYPTQVVQCKRLLQTNLEFNEIKYCFQSTSMDFSSCLTTDNMLPISFHLRLKRQNLFLRPAIKTNSNPFGHISIR